jgi:hypothetical protein
MDASREKETYVKFILRDSSTCTVPLECLPPDSLFAVLVRARQLAEIDIPDVLEVPVDSVDACDAHSLLCALYADYLMNKHVRLVHHEIHLYTGVSSTLLSIEYRRTRALNVLRRGLQRWSLKRLFRGASYKPLPHQFLYSKLLVIQCQVTVDHVRVDIPLPNVFAISRILPLIDHRNIYLMWLSFYNSKRVTLEHPSKGGSLPQLFPGEILYNTIPFRMELKNLPLGPRNVSFLVMTHILNVDFPMEKLHMIYHKSWLGDSLCIKYRKSGYPGSPPFLCMVAKGKSHNWKPFNTRLQEYVDSYRLQNWGDK